ncbi:MarR family winged helix-turn-helix transcriptional regulator [Cohnella yongneupensis]|uniref:MarR family winged helix-turn-helix transcriptional regulator n=1 Tax=Cohnella yongneupensis TaxID=425006 RepID=A0ABW0QSX5_9BACL
MNDDPFTIKDDHSTVDSLVQLSFLIQSILGQVGAAHNLSIIQIRLLGILRDREPSMLQLAQYLQLDKSSITGLINRAESRGLVERTVSQHDKRGFNVRVTSAGWELIPIVAQEIERAIHAATEVITEAERSLLAGLTTKILRQSVGQTK